MSEFKVVNNGDRLYLLFSGEPIASCHSVEFDDIDGWLQDIDRQGDKRCERIKEEIRSLMREHTQLLHQKYQIKIHLDEDS